MILFFGMRVWDDLFRKSTTPYRFTDERKASYQEWLALPETLALCKRQGLYKVLLKKIHELTDEPKRDTPYA